MELKYNFVPVAALAIADVSQAIERIRSNLAVLDDDEVHTHVILCGGVPLAFPRPDEPEAVRLAAAPLYPAPLARSLAERTFNTIGLQAEAVEVRQAHLIAIARLEETLAQLKRLPQ